MDEARYLQMDTICAFEHTSTHTRSWLHVCAYLHTIWIKEYGRPKLMHPLMVDMACSCVWRSGVRCAISEDYLDLRDKLGDDKVMADLADDFAEHFGAPEEWNQLADGL